MFLLNEASERVKYALNSFTIQNVSIKFVDLGTKAGTNDHLQYKMFLLNKVEKQLYQTEVIIYNTKCFY